MPINCGTRVTVLALSHARILAQEKPRQGLRRLCLPLLSRKRCRFPEIGAAAAHAAPPGHASRSHRQTLLDGVRVTVRAVTHLGDGATREVEVDRAIDGGDTSAAVPNRGRSAGLVEDVCGQ